MMAVSDNGFTLDQAIATHPALWKRMLELNQRLESLSGSGALTEVAEGRLAGMVEALAIVGGFDELDINERLVEDSARDPYEPTNRLPSNQFLRKTIPGLDVK